MIEPTTGTSEYFTFFASTVKTNLIAMQSGSQTVKELRPSPIAGLGSTKQEIRTHVPRGQTSYVHIRTAPLTENSFGFTKHTSVEPSTSIYQESSVENYWDNGRNSFREFISTPESKGTVNSLFFSTKLTRSAPIVHSSLSFYQPTSQESPARHRQGIAVYILVMNIILNSLNTH